MCVEIISFNAELSPPIYGLPQTMQSIIREVSKKRQAAIDFALGPALGAASIAIGSRIVLDAYGYSNRLNLWIMMIGRSTANKTAPMKDIYAPLYKINNRLFDEYSAKVELWQQPSVVTAKQMSWAMEVAYYSQASQLRMLVNITGSSNTT